jgi:hypothetical protein
MYLKTQDAAEPDDALYYLVAANGVFTVKKTELFASVTPATAVAGLEEQSPSVALAFPKLPRQLLEQIYGFFQFVYDRLDGEAIVFIFYSSARREFYVDAPPQQLTRRRTRGGWRTDGNVSYDAIVRPPGFIKLGDAHSHAECSPFFSKDDDLDDREDGLRIVMGRLHRSNPDVRASFVANGTRIPLDAGDVLEDFGEPTRPPEEWLRRVTCRYMEPRRTNGNRHAR